MTNAIESSIQVDRSDGIPRYHRPREIQRTLEPIEFDTSIPYSQAADAIARSALSPGSRRLLLGLLQTGRPAQFPGGGVGIEYGSLLKSAVRPDLIAAHVREAATHLHDRRIDVLIVPGMSGYPIGAAYAIAADIPAILLKKQKVPESAIRAGDFPVGSFVIPSYTGEGDVVISADLDAVRHIVEAIAAPQLEAQQSSSHPMISIRIAGADDIIDKAVMAHAITECAPDFCGLGVEETIRRHRMSTGDTRPIKTRIEMVSWVTPLIKTYNEPEAHLERHFGIRPFAGISVTGISLDPPAIGVAGLGLIEFPSASQPN